MTQTRLVTGDEPGGAYNRIMLGKVLNGAEPDAIVQVGVLKTHQLMRLTGGVKLTYGVTTLDRKPWEAIEAMDQVFARTDPLVIVTDERDDPFFNEIKLAYPDHHFIDWHILDHYGGEFAQLPQTDSLSLALLSQLVAAEARGRGERVVMTNGCFDLLHPGHIKVLAQSRGACDRLVVGLNSDASVKL